MPKEDRKINGQLVGPKSTPEWIAWRRNRDKQIANPRRLKTCNDRKDSKRAD